MCRAGIKAICLTEWLLGYIEGLDILTPVYSISYIYIDYKEILGAASVHKFARSAEEDKRCYLDCRHFSLKLFALSRSR